MFKSSKMRYPWNVVRLGRMRRASKIFVSRFDRHGILRYLDIDASIALTLIIKKQIVDIWFPLTTGSGYGKTKCQVT
jgi:hypothetical protein